MSRIGRRTFIGSSLLAAAPSNAIDDALRAGIASRNIPAVSAMVAGPGRTLYAGAFGRRDTAGPDVHPDSIFGIASMTKAITTVAALQLVEEGKVALDEPVVRHLPQFQNVQVLQSFDAAGKPVLAPAKTAPTLRHLLTHTSGLCYDVWDANMFRYTSQAAGQDESRPGPLMFEPGARWQYGQGLDWAGRLVETVSGMTLEAYFQNRILRPLGMRDTSFILPADRFDRLVATSQRGPDGRLQQNERKLPAAPKTFNGGGGLYSTAPDYIRFMQMILNRGRGPNNVRILQAKTVDSMAANQIGPLTAGKMKSFRPNLSSDVDMQPGETEKWSLAFLLNTAPYSGGRSAGSLAWAGLFNTFYWIDPKRRICAVILMQFLPFVDREAIGMLNDFERAVYRVNSR